MHVNADTAICEYYNNCKTLSFGKARETAVKQVLLTIKKFKKIKSLKYINSFQCQKSYGCSAINSAIRSSISSAISCEISWFQRGVSGFQTKFSSKFSSQKDRHPQVYFWMRIYLFPHREGVLVNLLRESPPIRRGYSSGLNDSFLD